MKKSLKYVLSIFVCLLIVGSGFSAWYFANENVIAETAKVQGGISVTDLSTLESILTIAEAGGSALWSSGDSSTKAVGALDITLDQGTTPAALTELIYFGVSAGKTSIDLVFTLELTAVEDKAQALLNSATLNVSVELSDGGDEDNDGLADYVVASFVPTADKTDSVPTVAEDATRRTITLYRTLSFSYKTGKKPQDTAAYNAMKTAMTNQTVTVSAVVA